MKKIFIIITFIGINATCFGQVIRLNIEKMPIVSDSIKAHQFLKNFSSIQYFLLSPTEIIVEEPIGPTYEWDLDASGTLERVYKYGKDKILVKEDVPGKADPKVTTIEAKAFSFIGAEDTDGFPGVELIIKSEKTVKVFHYNIESVQAHTKAILDYSFERDLDKVIILDTDAQPGKELLVTFKAPTICVLHDCNFTINSYPTNYKSSPVFQGTYNLDLLPGDELCFGDTTLVQTISGKKTQVESILTIINDGIKESREYIFGRIDRYAETWKVEGMMPSGILVVSWKQEDYPATGDHNHNTLRFKGTYRGGYRLISYNQGQQKKYLVYSHMADFDPKDFNMETLPVESNVVRFKLSAIPSGKEATETTNGSLGW